MSLNGNYDLYVLNKTKNSKELNNPLKTYCKDEKIDFLYLKNLLKKKLNKN